MKIHVLATVDNQQILVFNAEASPTVTPAEMTMIAARLMDRLLLEAHANAGTQKFTVEVEFSQPDLAGKTRAELIALHQQNSDQVHAAYDRMRELLGDGPAGVMDPARDAMDPARPWVGRNDVLVHELMLQAEPGLQGRVSLTAVKAWTDDQCRAVLEWAAGVNLAREVGDSTDQDIPPRPGFLPAPSAIWTPPR